MSEKSTEELDGKVAIVTGSARGIGRAIALELAHRGADVVISDVDESQAQTTATEFSELGRRSEAILCDVSQQDQVDSLVQETIRSMGKLDIFVNNAGIPQVVIEVGVRASNTFGRGSSLT